MDRCYNRDGNTSNFISIDERISIRLKVQGILPSQPFFPVKAIHYFLVLKVTWVSPVSRRRTQRQSRKKHLALHTQEGTRQNILLLLRCEDPGGYWISTWWVSGNQRGK